MARLLIVDDDRASLDLRQAILSRHGHKVATACDPTEARHSFSETAPEAVILDLRLPEPADGLALIREFRAASATLRIIVLSGWPQDLEGKTEAALVDAVFGKPIRMEKLTATLSQFWPQSPTEPRA